MTDRRVYGVVESGTYSTSAPNPHVQLAGALSGFGIRQTFAAALADGETVTVTIRATEDIWAVYSGVTFVDGTPDILDLNLATLLESSGTLSNGASVQVIAIEPAGYESSSGGSLEIIAPSLAGDGLSAVSLDISCFAPSVSALT